jgi:hypothetical protein
MEPMREQHPLAQHALETRRKLNLGHRERMPEMQRAVHVRKRKVAEPLGILFEDLRLGEARTLSERRRLDFEDALRAPLGLVFGLE